MKPSLMVIIAAVLLGGLITGCSSGGDQDTVPVVTQPSFYLPKSSYMPEIPRVSVHEVKAILDAGGHILIVDSREHENYEKGHIEGAVSLPYDEMSEPYTYREGYDEIVTYCT